MSRVGSRRTAVRALPLLSPHLNTPLTSLRGTEAAKWAEKAQICFNESLRSLQQHQDLLKRDEAEACEDLKETGLLQAVQLYNLMYGGKALAMGITRTSPPSLRSPIVS